MSAKSEQLYTFGLNDYLVQKDMRALKKGEKRIGKNAGIKSGMLDQVDLVTEIKNFVNQSQGSSPCSSFVEKSLKSAGRDLK